MIKLTSTLRGEKLKDMEERAFRRMGKWTFGRGKAKEKAETRFSFRAARRMPSNARKKMRLGGVSGGRR